MIKRRLERLEHQTPERLILATIPKDSSLNEATHIYEANLKRMRQNWSTIHVKKAHRSACY